MTVVYLEEVNIVKPLVGSFTHVYSPREKAFRPPGHDSLPGGAPSPLFHSLVVSQFASDPREIFAQENQTETLPIRSAQ